MMPSLRGCKICQEQAQQDERLTWSNAHLVVLVPGNSRLLAAVVRPELQQIALGYDALQHTFIHHSYRRLSCVEKRIGFLDESISLQFGKGCALYMAYDRGGQRFTTGDM